MGSMVMKCPYCNKNIVSSAKFCHYCGKEIKEVKTLKHCIECGNKVKVTSKFCSSCGYELKSFNKQYEKEEDNEEESKEDKNEGWDCEYCGKNFTTETACLRHEKNCSEKPYKERETIPSYQQNYRQKSNAGVIIFVVIIIIIAAIILMAMYGQQQQAASFSGQTESLINKIFGG